MRQVLVGRGWALSSQIQTFHEMWGDGSQQSSPPPPPLGQTRSCPMNGKTENSHIPEFSWKKRLLEFSPSLNPKSNKQLIFHVNLYLGKIISYSLRGKKGTLGNTLIKADFCKPSMNSCQRREQVAYFLLLRNGKITNVSLIPEVIHFLGNILHW